jgi:hypothetical protein
MRRLSIISREKNWERDWNEQAENNVQPTAQSMSQYSGG